jgi:uncharacterized protein (TIGR01244 family)
VPASIINGIRRLILWSVVALVLFPFGFAVWWLGWYDNYHVVLPGDLYRGGQSSSATLAAHIARDGLHTVINLRPETNELWHVQEQQICERAGVKFIDFPLEGDRAPTPEQTSSLIALLRGAQHPVLVHCDHGADRTSFAVELYLRQITHRSAPEARKAFSLCYGHLWFTRERCFDDAFDQFLRSKSSGGAALLDFSTTTIGHESPSGGSQ